MVADYFLVVDSGYHSYIFLKNRCDILYNMQNSPFSEDLIAKTDATYATAVANATHSGFQRYIT
ncbi:hypothetical protein ccbrp13_53570 [Ktedonobacteria bacterium brp13]|nr:hypothetical protein ccbrp13_53570 [Ktedonobacteria bacterium brp13]